MNRNRPKLHRTFIPILLLLLILASCQSLPSPSADPGFEQVALPATATPWQPLPTETMIPTLQPSPTSTATPTPQPSPTAASCREEHGRIESFQIENTVFQKSLVYRVYLPPCYNPELSTGYPILYLLHGQTQTEELWEEMGILDIADQLITSNEAPPFIIVMPLEEYYLQYFNESVFDNELLEILVPTMEQSYVVNQDRSCRAIGGISRGASWAVYLGFIHWENFGVIGAHSVPNAPFSASRLNTLLTAIPSDQLPRIAIDIGNSDMYYDSAIQLDNLLTYYDVPHEWLVSDGSHNIAYWQSHLEQYLRWYTQSWDICVPANS